MLVSRVTPTAPPLPVDAAPLAGVPPTWDEPPELPLPEAYRVTTRLTLPPPLTTAARVSFSVPFPPLTWFDCPPVVRSLPRDLVVRPPTATAPDEGFVTVPELGTCVLPEWAANTDVERRPPAAFGASSRTVSVAHPQSIVAKDAIVVDRNLGIELVIGSSLDGFTDPSPLEAGFVKETRQPGPFNRRR